MKFVCALTLWIAGGLAASLEQSATAISPRAPPSQPPQASARRRPELKRSKSAPQLKDLRPMVAADKAEKKAQVATLEANRQAENHYRRLDLDTRNRASLAHDPLAQSAAILETNEKQQKRITAKMAQSKGYTEAAEVSRKAGRYGRAQRNTVKAATREHRIAQIKGDQMSTYHQETANRAYQYQERLTEPNGPNLRLGWEMAQFGVPHHDVLATTYAHRADAAHDRYRHVKNHEGGSDSRNPSPDHYIE